MQLIDKNRVLELLDNYFRDRGFWDSQSPYDIIMSLKYAIADLPVEKAESVRHGKWVRKDGNGYYKYVCSCCGGDIPKNTWGQDSYADYCPTCGAKMDLGGDEEC